MSGAIEPTSHKGGWPGKLDVDHAKCRLPAGAKCLTLEKSVMKKSLVALAAMSVIGAVSAQSSVTLYGLADAYGGSERIGGGTYNALTGVQVTPNANGTTQTVVNSGGQNGSRWGLRVSEDLGGGLAAIAQFESGFNIDTGSQTDSLGRTQTLFGRQAFVGLKSGFGTVALGRQYGPYDDMKGVLSLQGNNAFDATGGGVDGTEYGPGIGAWVGYNPRVNNSIKFQSNNYSGLSFSAIYGMGEDKSTNVSASSTFGIGAMYANGPITVGLVHQNEGFTRSATNGKNELENTLLAGAYDFGVAKLGGGYNEARVRANGNADPKSKEWFIALSAPLGATTLKAQYARSKQNFGSVSYENDSIGLDAVYDFSKRTSAYVGYNATTFDQAGPTGGDLKNRRFGVGLRHKF